MDFKTFYNNEWRTQLSKIASHDLDKAVEDTKTKELGVDDVIKKLPPEKRDDYLAKLRQEKKGSHPFISWLLKDPSSGLGKYAATTPPMEAVKAYLKDNPRPTDSEVHKWAEANGWDRDKTERMFYSLAADHVSEGHA